MVERQPSEPFSRSPSHSNLRAVFARRHVKLVQFLVGIGCDSRTSDLTCHMHAYLSNDVHWRRRTTSRSLCQSKLKTFLILTSLNS